MTDQPRRRQDDLDRVAVETLQADITMAARRLGFSVTEFAVTRNLLQPQGWTTISIRMTQVPERSHGRLVEAKDGQS